VSSTVARATALRGAFDRAGYDEERVAAALHVDPPIGALVAAANRRRLGDDLLGTLIRLFLVGERTPPSALTEEELADALDLRLLRRVENGVEASVAVVPFRGGLVAHDHEGVPVERADHVAGVGPATRTLASLTVRRHARRALDIGTGNAAQALLLARHADEVVATDVNPRALALAGATLRLNEIDNVDLREGSFFEPIAGERFDLIATNPPWVVSPDSAFVYRDAGLDRDELSRMFVQTVPQHLADEGMATMLLCWLPDEEEDWSAPVRRWLVGSGCDAVVVRYVADDAISYGTKWTEDESDTDRWIDYFDAAGIDCFATGAVVLRKAGTERVVAYDAADGPSGSASDQLLRIFDALDFDGDLLGERLALAPHRLAEQLAWTGTGYAPEYLTLRLDEGAGLDAPVDPAALQTLFALDGSRPLRELPGAEAALPTIRRLFELGFVERR
jgi:methylase of polypeptide subunit release factors